MVPEWEISPPSGWIEPRPSLFEDAVAAIGHGTGQERANAAAVQAAAQSIDAGDQGPVGFAPHVDRDLWNRTTDLFPPNSRPALRIAASATQHGVRTVAMANMAITGGVYAGTMSRNALQAVELADISALRGERAAIALCEAQVAALTTLLAMQPKVSPPR